jgi:hypothetical protein
LPASAGAARYKNRFVGFTNSFLVFNISLVRVHLDAHPRETLAPLLANDPSRDINN